MDRIEDSTLPRSSEHDRGSARARGARVTLVLACDRPLERGALCDLGSAGELLLGRGDLRALSPAAGGSAAAFRIADARMSREHARLARAGGNWLLEDLGSRNGTLVDGQPTRQRLLADGALLELGKTFLLFRTAAAGGEHARVLEAPADAAPAGLRTLVPELAAELEKLRRVARAPVDVLLRGETGTGKEVLARAVHALSGRSGPFVAVNCGAIAPGLVESELFGHKQGAFSGAAEDRPGLVRSADRGTLLLDEIGDLPLPAQAALLRVLQEREVTPVGGVRPVQVDLRVIAATHLDLPALAAAGKFRRDLLARLDGFSLLLPPLRERREDLGLFIAELLQRLAPERSARLRFHHAAARALLLHQWPGNVRELEKCLAAALALAPGDEIELTHLPAAVREALVAARSAPPQEQGSPAAPGGGEADERQKLVALLAAHHGNLASVARALGKDRTQIRRLLKQHALLTDLAVIRARKR